MILSRDYKIALTVLFIASSLMFACTGSKTLAIDRNLHDNSFQTLAKTKTPLFTMGRAAIGQFKTLEFSKLDSPILKIRSDKFFSFHLFRHEQSTQKRKAYTFSMTDGNDTAFANMYIWTKEITSEPGFLSKKNSEILHTSKDALGEIYNNKEGSIWNFNILNYGLYANAGSETTGFLKSEKDSLPIRAIRDFTTIDRRFDYIRTKGISIDDGSGNSVAALQLVGPANVWIKKDLPPQTQLAIAGIFGIILGSRE